METNPSRPSRAHPVAATVRMLQKGPWRRFPKRALRLPHRGCVDVLSDQLGSACSIRGAHRAAAKLGFGKRFRGQLTRRLGRLRLCRRHAPFLSRSRRNDQWLPRKQRRCLEKVVRPNVCVGDDVQPIRDFGGADGMYGSGHFNLHFTSRASRTQ